MRKHREILVTLNDGRKIVYTTAILGLLVDSGDCTEIVDRATGALIWRRKTLDTHDIIAVKNGGK